MYTLNGAPFFLDEIKVTQDVNAGDLIYKDAGKTELEGDATSYRFSGLGSENGKLYSYSVKALRTFRTESCVSAESEMQLVDLTSAVENIEAEDAALAAYGENGDIIVTSAPGNVVRIFNVQGVEVARATVPSEGSLRIHAECGGIYIVSDGSAAVKLTI